MDPATASSSSSSSSQHVVAVGGVESRARRLSNAFFPRLRRDSCMGIEEPYVVSSLARNSSSSSSSSGSSAYSDKRLLASGLRPKSLETTTTTTTTTVSPDDGEGGDDDDDDVPVTCSQTIRCFNQAVLRDVEAEFAYFETAAALLASAYDEREPRYMCLRREWAAGRAWTRDVWDEFLVLDELMAAVRAELFAAQERMQERLALMRLFQENNITRPKQGLGVWSMQGDVRVWSLDGAVEEREVLVLEWKGVDYNNAAFENLGS